MIIKQFVIDSSISFFQDNFIRRWSLEQYSDIDKPLFFFGFGGNQSIFESHNSWKVILPSTPGDLPNFNLLKNIKNTILLVETDLSNFYIPDEVIVKKIILEIKDYSKFKPTILGDKIYFYSGFTNWSPNSKSFINDIQSRINYEIITTEHMTLSDYYNIDELVENFYNKCFVSLNFTHEFVGHSSGMTTCRELALMGRKTITGYNPYPYNCLIRTRSIDEIIQSINEESKKIGTIQEKIDIHNYNQEYLDIDYILKNY